MERLTSLQDNSSAPLVRSQSLERYVWSDKQKNMLRGFARRNPDPLGNPDSTKAAVVQRYDALCDALHACKHNTVVGAEDYEPPTAEEKKKLKHALSNWWSSPRCAQ